MANKFDRQLQLMLLLTQNISYTLEELSTRLDMSARTIYRYIDSFRAFGFNVEQRNGIFRLDKSSPYFRQISELVHFTEDEALTLRKVLEGATPKNEMVIHLLQKLSRLYDFEVLDALRNDNQYAKNLQGLYQAIKEGRIAILHDYSSPHSHQTSDRLVEPFALLSTNSEVRCYEINSHQNKTFKITRIGSVEVLETTWINADKHIRVYTDLFQFSGEQQQPVTLRLDRLAAHLLLEECPTVSKDDLVADGDDHWIFRTQVCSFLGIGRFVMGLFPSIKILENEAFRQYIATRVKEMNEALNHKP